jgi:hypothetical protein
MSKTTQQIKEENAIQNRVARGIADIRIARLSNFIGSYRAGYLTAEEFLTVTDNILQDELKQAIGR